MKRILAGLLAAIILLMLSTSASAKAKTAANTRYRIEKLSSPTIKIGKQTLKEGDTFSAADEIHWSTPKQSMLVRNMETAQLVRFSQRQAEKRGKIRSIFDLYKQINMGSTRGTYDYIYAEKSPKAASFPERRVALVIGNQNYEYLSPLKNAQKDAEDISQTLLDLGFDVIELYETNYPELMAGINKFSGLAKDYDVALFYYAGHGIQEKNINYLVPIDNELERENDLRDCVSCNEIVEKVEASGCPSKIFYFDACRDRKTSWSRSALNGLSAMEGGVGTVIVFATQSGMVALDGERDDNSPFAKMLIKNMQIAQSFPQAMSALVKETHNLTHSQQYPVRVGELIHDFWFNPNGETPKYTSHFGSASSYYIGARNDDDDLSNRTPIYLEAQSYENCYDYSKAMETYLKEPENPLCQTEIGCLYMFGDGVEQDFDKAKEWLKKAIAQTGSVTAMERLGECYKMEGDGLAALEFYKQAWENGGTWSAACIGNMHVDESMYSRIHFNPEKALEWYKKGAEKGDGWAMMGISNLYYDNLIADKTVMDFVEKALEWKIKAAETGDKKIQFWLGWDYLNGNLSEADDRKALEWFLKSANQGYPDAIKAIARLYYYGGSTIPIDYEKACEWAKKGADILIPQCMIILGEMFYNENSFFEQNFKQAFRWFEKAAMCGDRDAMEMVGKMYINGEGIAKNETLGQEWLRKATDYAK